MSERIGADVRVALNLGVLSARGKKAVRRVDSALYSTGQLFRGVGEWASDKLYRRQTRAFNRTLQGILTISQQLIDQKKGLSVSYLLGEYSHANTKYQILFHAAGLDRQSVEDRSVPTVAIKPSEGHNTYYQKIRIYGFDPTSKSFKKDDSFYSLTESLGLHHVNLKKMRKQFLSNFKTWVSKAHGA